MKKQLALKGVGIVWCAIFHFQDDMCTNMVVQPCIKGA